MQALTRVAILFFALDIVVCAGITFAGPAEQQRVFSSLSFAILQIALAVLVVPCILMRLGLGRRGWTGLILHAGVLVVAVGGVLTYWLGRTGAIAIAEGESADSFAVQSDQAAAPEKLGFKLALDKVEVRNYPHSQMWESVTSRLRITDEEGTHEAEVSVNRPLKWKGLRIYQMGFDVRAGGPRVSFMQVSRESGYYFVYGGCGLVVLGLALNLFRRRSDAQGGPTQ